jgi:hypothetical protein
LNLVGRDTHVGCHLLQEIKIPFWTTKRRRTRSASIKPLSGKGAIRTTNADKSHGDDVVDHTSERCVEV